jgi:hypothetical protein
LTRWAEETTMEDYNIETTKHFLFEHLVTRFGCPRVLMSDQGNHLINNTIQAMTEEFEIHHQKSTPYCNTSVLSPILNNVFCEFMKGHSAQTIRRG